MKFLTLIIFLFFMSTVFALSKVSKEKIVFYTTTEYPYQLENQEGATFEILKGVYQLLGEGTPAVNFLPWIRTFNIVKEKRNTAIFSISRKLQREKFFDWCCYLYEAPRNELFTLRNSSIHILSDLENKSGAVWRGDTSEILIDSLIKKTKNLKKVDLNNNIQAIKMLLKKRVDFIITKEPLLFDACHSGKLNCRNIVHRNLKLGVKSNRLYIALSKKMSKNLKEKFTNAFKKFKMTPQYFDILKKYSLSK